MDRNRFIQCMKSNIELSDKERRRIIRRSVESQPWKLKCTIAMEEFAELTQAISKQIRGYDNRIGLLEEMAQIIKDQDEEICLLRNDFMVGSLSEEILNMTVTGIENDENIENTVVVYVTDEED